MAMDVGELLARVEVDLSGLKEGLNKATTQFSMFEGVIEDVNDTIKSHTNAMSNSMDKMGNKISDVSRKMGQLNSAIRQTSLNSLQAIERLSSNGESQLRGLDIGFRVVREGIDQCVVEMRNFNTAMSRMNSVRVPTTSFSTMSGHIRESNSGLLSMLGSGNSLFYTFSKMSLLFYIIKEDIEAVYHAMNLIAGQGISFYKDIETSQVGMAGIISSMTTLNGKQLDWNTAMQESKAITKDIANNALLTTVTTKELQQTFQALLAPGLRAGMTIEEITDLSTVGANAVKSMGLKSDQLVQELRDLVQGGITARSSTLATSLGLTDSDIEKAKNSAEGLYKFLIRQMQGFAQATNEMGQTLDGYTSNIVDSFQRISAEGLGGFIDYLKRDVLKPLQDSLVKVESHVNELGKKVIDSVTPNPAILRFYSLLGDSFEKLIEGGKAFGTAILPVLELLGGTLKIVVDVFALLLEIIGNVILSFTNFTDATAGAEDVFNTLEGIIGYIRDNMGFVVEVLDALLIRFVALNVIIPAFNAIMGSTVLGTALLSVFNGNLIVALKALGDAFLLASAKMLVIIGIVATLIFVGVMVTENWGRVKMAFVAYLDAMHNKALAIVNAIKSMFYSLAVKVAGFFNNIIDKANSIGLGKVLGGTFNRIDTSGLQDSAITSGANATDYNAEANRQFAYGDYNMGIAIQNTINSIKGQFNNLLNFKPYSPKTKSLFDNPEHVQGLKVNPKDDDGKGKKGKDPADKEAQDALKAYKNELEGVIALTKEWAKIQEDFVNDSYKNGLLSMYEYLTSLKTIEIQKHEITMASLQAELDEAKQKENSLAEQQKIQNKIDMEELKFFESRIKNIRQARTEYENFHNTLNKIYETYSKLTGNIFNSTIVSLFDSNKLNMSRILSEIESAERLVKTDLSTITDPDKLQKASAEKENAENMLPTLRQALEMQIGILNNKLLSAKQTEFENSLKRISLGLDIQALNLSGKSLTDLQKKQILYDNTKESMSDMLGIYAKLIAIQNINIQQGIDVEKSMENVKKYTKEVYDLVTKIDPLAQDFVDHFTKGMESGFKTFMSDRTKSWKESMHEVTKSLGDMIFEETSKNMANNIRNLLQLNQNSDPVIQKFHAQVEQGMKEIETQVKSGTEQVKNSVIQYRDAFKSQANALSDAINNQTIPAMQDLASTIKDYVLPMIMGKDVDQNFDPYAHSKQVKNKGNIATKDGTEPDKDKDKGTGGNGGDNQSLKKNNSIVDKNTQELITFGQTIAMISGSQGLGRFFTALQMTIQIMDTLGKINSTFGLFSFSTGGYVSGAGTSTSDSIPSWLSNGEFVVRAGIVNKYGRGYFEALNSGTLPQLHFANGGYVGSGSSSAQSDSFPTINVNINSPSFHSNDPRENQRMFEQQTTPLVKAKLVEALKNDSVVRNLIRGVR